MYTYTQQHLGTWIGQSYRGYGYLQVDLETIKKITKLAIQGSHTSGYPYRTNYFNILLSKDGIRLYHIYIKHTHAHTNIYIYGLADFNIHPCTRAHKRIYISVTYTQVNNTQTCICTLIRTHVHTYINANEVDDPPCTIRMDNVAMF